MPMHSLYSTGKQYPLFLVLVKKSLNVCGRHFRCLSKNSPYTRPVQHTKSSYIMQSATDCTDCELVVGAFKEMLHKALKHLFRTIERVLNSCDFSKQGFVMCCLNVLYRVDLCEPMNQCLWVLPYLRSVSYHTFVDIFNNDTFV